MLIDVTPPASSARPLEGADVFDSQRSSEHLAALIDRAEHCGKRLHRALGAVLLVSIILAFGSFLGSDWIQVGNLSLPRSSRHMGSADGFIILLLTGLVRISLDRFRIGQEVTLDRARRCGCVDSAYERLALGQLYFRPALLSTGQPASWNPRSILLVLPVAAQVICLVNAYSMASRAGVLASGVTLGFVFWVAFSCIVATHKVQSEWNRWHALAREASPPTRRADAPAPVENRAEAADTATADLDVVSPLEGDKTRALEREYVLQLPYGQYEHGGSLWIRGAAKSVSVEGVRTYARCPQSGKVLDSSHHSWHSNWAYIDPVGVLRFGYSMKLGWGLLRALVEVDLSDPELPRIEGDYRQLHPAANPKTGTIILFKAAAETN